MRLHHVFFALTFGALATAACKDKDPTGDDVSDEEGDADTDTDTDADSDADADADSDADADVACWIAGPDGDCFAVGDLDGDGTSDCELPTAPEGDSLKFLNQCGDGSASSAVFDNAARIPAATWVPGTPLPPVP